MKTAARISHQQLLCLVTIYNQIAAVLFLPAALARAAGHDAWLAVPVGIAAGAVPVSVLLGLLVRRHPHVELGALAEYCLGRWPGKFACLLHAAFSLFLCSLIIRNMMDFSVVALLPGTPILVIAALLLGTVAYATLSGAEVIVRLAVLVLILAALSVSFMAVGLLNQAELVRVQPVLGKGVWPVLQGAWPLMGWTGEMVALAPFLALVERPQKALGAMLWGNALAALILTLLVGLSLAVFTPALVLKLTYPGYSLVREVAVGQFLERLEIGLITVWLSGMVVKAASCLWTAGVCTTSAFGLKSDRYVGPVLAVAVFYLTRIWPSETMQANFSIKYWTQLMLPFEFGLPLLLLAGSWLRKGARPGVGV